MRLQAESVGSVQNSVSNFPNMCHIGAIRSKVVDVDRQDARVKTWRPQVVFQHRRQTSESRQEKARACVQPIGVARNYGKMGVEYSTGTPSTVEIPSSRFSTIGREPSKAQSGGACLPNRTANSGVSPQVGTPKCCKGCVRGERNRLKSTEVKIIAAGVHNQSLLPRLLRDGKNAGITTVTKSGKENATVKQASYDAKTRLQSRRIPGSKYTLGASAEKKENCCLLRWQDRRIDKNGSSRQHLWTPAAW